jgi:hypothetical protein
MPKLMIALTFYAGCACLVTATWWLHPIAGLGMLGFILICLSVVWYENIKGD